MGLSAITKTDAVASVSQMTTSQAQAVKPVEQAASPERTTKDMQAALNNPQNFKGDGNVSLKEEDDVKITEDDIRELNKIMNSGTVAEFGYYEPVNRITIKIKDKETGDVIREIPSEKMLKAFKKACEIAGLIVDEKR